MNGCRSTLHVYDPATREGGRVACLGHHASGELHRGCGGAITWTDAEAYPETLTTDEPRLFTVPAEPLPPGTWSNVLPHTRLI